MANFSDMLNSGYFLYMAEADGLDDIVTTRQARINAAKREFVDELRSTYDDVNNIFQRVLRNHNLTEADLTSFDKTAFQTLADEWREY